jgi:hypothetical protein
MLKAVAERGLLSNELRKFGCPESSARNSHERKAVELRMICWSELDIAPSLIWKLDCLGRLQHLIEVTDDLTKRGAGSNVLQGALVDTTTSQGKLIFAMFAALAEFERDIIRERTVAGLQAARARGRKGRRRHVFTASKLRRSGFVPSAAEHYVENTGDGPLCFLGIFCSAPRKLAVRFFHRRKTPGRKFGMQVAEQEAEISYSRPWTLPHRRRRSNAPATTDAVRRARGSNTARL